ncbi:bifunctional DNA primase/polymerase [Streptomyces sp. NPDC086777]|uniref:bifunctional DNA primase/polymerase n=1 Tax=Streptomyces sp. NPDC086777 TaxID=3154866 RepID=UPI00344DFDE1
MQRMTRRGIEWLSAAADDPEGCRATWIDDPRAPYMLPTGRYFDVVTVDQRVGMETFDQLLRRGLPFGPTVLDHKAQRVGFFLGSRSQETFLHYLAREEGTAPAYRYLSRGSAVVVPGPIPLRGDRYEWLRAPARRPMANPLRPVALATMLVASAELLARVDRYGERYRAADTFGLSAIEGAPIDGAG